MIKKIPVLIVGAGPCGLTMAALLHHHHIDYRLIEQRRDIIKTSNALAVHSRTLEMLDDIGIIDDFIKTGQRIEGFTLNDHDTKICEIPIRQIPSHYPFILSIPQYRTEEILNDHLNKVGHRAEREKTLTAIQQHNDTVQVTVTDVHQQVEHLHCRYLVACDGAHSTVRKLLDIPFTGTDLSEQFIVADVHLKNTHSNNQAKMYFDTDGPFGVFPYKAGNARIIATLSHHHRDPKQPVSLLELRHIAEKRTAHQINIAEIQWASAFQIHSRILEKFRERNVFFVGDAAHIHSPAGGQGMNTGMQDAYNLAWKIAIAIKHKPSVNLLDSYQEERYPIASKLLRNTEQLTQFILLKNPLLRWVRFNIVKWLLNKRFFQQKIVAFISMLGLKYENSTIINTSAYINAKSPRPGHRMPDTLFHGEDGMSRLYDLLKTEKHTLLIFTGNHLSQHHLDQIQAIQLWQMKQSTLINRIIVTSKTAAHQIACDCIVDIKNDLHAAYHILNPSFILIRPDNYIGCCADRLNLEPLENYWRNILRNNEL